MCPLVLGCHCILPLLVKNLPAVQETWSLDQEDPLEKGMALHYCILAWRIPWIEEPGGLQSKGSQRIRHDWVTNILLVTGNQYTCDPVWYLYFKPSTMVLPHLRHSIFVFLLPQWVPWSSARWMHLLTLSLLQYSQTNLKITGASLVVQWLRICLPMQGTWVWSLIRELRSHMLWGNQACELQLPSLYATNKTQHS